MPLEVIYAPEADKDLDHLFYFILPRSGHRVALAYIERIEAFCKRSAYSHSAAMLVTICLPDFVL